MHIVFTFVEFKVCISYWKTSTACYTDVQQNSVEIMQLAKESLQILLEWNWFTEGLCQVTELRLITFTCEIRSSTYWRSLLMSIAI